MAGFNSVVIFRIASFYYKNLMSMIEINTNYEILDTQSLKIQKIHIVAIKVHLTWVSIIKYIFDFKFKWVLNNWKNCISYCQRFNTLIWFVSEYWKTAVFSYFLFTFFWNSILVSVGIYGKLGLNVCIHRVISECVTNADTIIPLLPFCQKLSILTGVCRM